MQTYIDNSALERAVQYLFDEEAHLTGITEFGISWEDLRNGKAQVPPQGARFDITFEGKLSGPEISGVLKGIDYLEVRTDGKFMLNIYVTIITDDGETIALKEDGVLTPTGQDSADLHLNMQFSTASLKYQWLNKKQVWGIGKVNMSEGTIKVQGFAA